MPGSNRRFSLPALLVSAAALAFAQPASAYTAFLKPADFSPAQDQRLDVEMSFATTFFTPGIGLASGGLHAFRPDGSRTAFGSVAVGADKTRADLDIRSTGTYRFSSGEILGAVVTMVAQDEGWRPLGQGEVLEEGALTTTLQTVTVAESYASNGYPTDAALAPSVGRLAIRPVTHPNMVTPQTGLTLELLLDGAPFPNMPFVLYAQGDLEADLDTTFVTDAAGRAHITVPAPGQYMVAIRYRGDAPASVEADVQSYTTTLTFEAVDVLPTPPPPEPERRRRRDRN